MADAGGWATVANGLQVLITTGIIALIGGVWKLFNNIAALSGKLDKDITEVKGSLDLVKLSMNYTKEDIHEAKAEIALHSKDHVRPDDIRTINRSLEDLKKEFNK